MQRHSRRSAWVRLEADVTTSKQFDASDDPIDEQYLGLIHCKKKKFKRSKQRNSENKFNKIQIHASIIKLLHILITLQQGR